MVANESEALRWSMGEGYIQEMRWVFSRWQNVESCRTATSLHAHTNHSGTRKKY